MGNKNIDLKKLYWKAWRLNYLWHPFRNNPRNANAIYYGLKYCVGLENWEKINPDVRNSWDSAVFSFDKLFGQLKVYKDLDMKSLIIEEKYKNPKEIETDLITNTLKQGMNVLEKFKYYEEKNKLTVADYNFLKAFFEIMYDEGALKTIIFDYLKEKAEETRKKQEEAKVKEKTDEKQEGKE